MSVIVTEAGFTSENWTSGFAPFDQARAGQAVDLAPGDDPEALSPILDDLPLIRISFASSADGRGSSLAASLRQNGYTGRLRAYGPLISDQLPMALQSGFDEVEIPDALAERQGEDHWRGALGAYAGLSYQSRLRQSA